METEIRHFKAHEKLLYDVMTRQAGSMQKALIEAVMNSVDAKATKVSFQITRKQTIIEDDGKGMTREEILKFFEFFGLPHEEGEDKTYGEFRMGRGQLFAFGINIWHTKTNKMVVNIKTKGLDYILDSDTENFEGCRIIIDHYKEMEDFDLRRMIEEFSKMIMYVSIPVFVNGNKVNASIDSEKYDYDLKTDQAIIRLAGSCVGLDVKVYNRGVFVTSLNHEGVSGIIITSVPIKLNFARNDILDDCKIWQTIQVDYIKFKKQIFLQMAKRYLDENAKKAIISLMYNDQECRKMYGKLKVLRTSSGSWVSLDSLAGKSVAFAKDGDRIGDKIMQQGIGIVLDQDFCYDMKALVRSCSYSDMLKTVEITSLSKDLQITNKPVADDQLKPRELKNLAKLRTLSSETNCTHGRRIMAGESVTSMGWTDGQTYICISRDILKLKTMYGFDQKGFILLMHEVTHDNSDESADLHGDEFHKRFHDNCFKYAEKFGEISGRKEWK